MCHGVLWNGVLCHGVLWHGAPLGRPWFPCACQFLLQSISMPMQPRCRCLMAHVYMCCVHVYMCTCDMCHGNEWGARPVCTIILMLQLRAIGVLYLCTTRRISRTACCMLLCLITARQLDRALPATCDPKSAGARNTLLCVCVCL